MPSQSVSSLGVREGEGNPLMPTLSRWALPDEGKFFPGWLDRIAIREQQLILARRAAGQWLHLVVKQKSTNSAHGRWKARVSW